MNQRKFIFDEKKIGERIQGMRLTRVENLDKIYRCKTLLMAQRMRVLNETNFHPRNIDQTTMSPTMIVRVS